MNPPEKKWLSASPDEWLKHAVSDIKFARLGKKEQDFGRQRRRVKGGVNAKKINTNILER